MTDHEYFEELISRMLDDELTADEMRELDAHIAVCPDCRLTAEAFGAVHAALNEELCETPEGMSEKIMAEIRRSAIRKKNRRLRPFLAAAACLAVVLLGSAAIRGGAMKDGAVMQAAAGATESFAAVYSEAENGNVRKEASADAASVTDREESSADNGRELPAAEFSAEAEEAFPKPEEPFPKPEEPSAMMLGLASDTVYFLDDAECMEALRQLLSDEKTEETPENAALFSVVCDADGSVIYIYEQSDGTVLYTDNIHEGCFAGACTAEDCRNFVMENAEK